MIRAFSFLQRDPQSGILSFRLRVPGYLQKQIGRTEIKRSLRTADKRLAIPVAMRLYVEVQELFHQIENGEPMQKPKRQKEQDLDFIGKVTFDELLLPGGAKAKGVTIDTGDDAKDIKLARELLGTVGATLKQTTSFSDSAKLAKIAKKYQCEKIAEGSWTEKTSAEYEALYELLIQIVGNVEISTVNHKTAREFKDRLLGLPPNMGKGQFAGKTVKQILAMNYKERMAVHTVNGKIQRISSLFLWAVRHGYTAMNPFDGLKLKENRRAQDQREKFSDEDLQAIFNLNRFNQKNLRKPFMYWVPLLALFTGCRVKELAQLRTQDVANNVVSISEDAGRLKTLAGTRTIPIHPKIVELGFLQYVNQVKAAGHERLFPEAWDTQNGPGDKVSRWFAVYRKNLGIGKTKKGDSKESKCFHSFRHCFADGLKQAGVDPLKISQLMGHADSSVTTGRYGKDFSTEALYEAICMLTFPIMVS